YERWLDVKKDETVEKNGSDLYLDTQVYLSLVRASDNAVKELVETYKESDEPTMIIFFGDHQPGLPSPAVNELYTDMDSYLDMFKSKFFIWTNYDSPEEHDVEISANYLSLLILRQGGFGYNPYFRMLEEVHGKYPVITSQGVIDSEGKEYLGVAELEDDPLIRKYRNIQYANLHGDMDPAWFEVKE
ncbi:MAG: sulfatase-like hydrolase/transferase, partial [Lachnospiraceae bacterium]|nr:sulfatase-like hydrolase/transferase [Lachnospiraceae bacterium]